VRLNDREGRGKTKNDYQNQRRERRREKRWGGGGETKWKTIHFLKSSSVNHHDETKGGEGMQKDASQEIPCSPWEIAGNHDGRVDNWRKKSLWSVVPQQQKGLCQVLHRVVGGGGNPTFPR